MVKIHFIEKFTSQTPIIFTSFGGVTAMKYFISTKNDRVMDPKKFDCRYLQKDSIEHFENHGGN